MQSRGTLNSEHDRHDRLLVARYAASDAYPSEIDDAKRLVDNCDECASLAADIRLIATRTSELHEIKRPRDFRISADQAETLRGSWFDRLMRGFQAPGWAVVRPLAGAALAVGLVLVVVGALPLNNFTSHAATDAALPAAPVTAQGGSKAVAPSSPQLQPAASIGGSQAGGAPEAAPTTATVPDAAAAPPTPTEQQPVNAPASAGSVDTNASIAPPPGYGVGSVPLPSAAASLTAAVATEPPKKGGPTPAPATPAARPEATPPLLIAAAPSAAPSSAPVNAPAEFGNAAITVDSNSSLNQSALIVGGLVVILLALMALALVWIARRRYSDPLAR